MTAQDIADFLGRVHTHAPDLVEAIFALSVAIDADEDARLMADGINLITNAVGDVTVLSVLNSLLVAAGEEDLVCTEHEGTAPDHGPILGFDTMPYTDVHFDPPLD